MWVIPAWIRRPYFQGSDILDHLTYGATVGFSGASDNIAFGFNVGYTTSSHSNDVAGAAQVRYIF